MVDVDLGVLITLKRMAGERRGTFRVGCLSVEMMISSLCLSGMSEVHPIG